MTRRLLTDYIFCRENHFQTPRYQFADRNDQEVTTNYIFSIVSETSNNQHISSDKLNCEIESEVVSKY